MDVEHPPWPSQLWVVRHGQSAGNVARDVAHEAALDRIALEGRDVDVPLSALGEEQARALGRWFATEFCSALPEIILSSPYRRSVQTAQLFREEGGAGMEEKICLDERLREKEFGILDGLTTHGVARLEPEYAVAETTSKYRDALFAGAPAQPAAANCWSWNRHAVEVETGSPACTT